MNYIGSKHTLADFIQLTVASVVGEDLSALVFCDLFAGTGAVGRAFQSRVKQVIANDFEYYSYVLNRHYLGRYTDIDEQTQLIDELNQLPPIDDGFIYQHYCMGSGSQRQYFSNTNGQRIDAIRQRIDTWQKQGVINSQQFYFLLTSLLESADKVANTASVYGAFLKQVKKTAQKPLVLQAAPAVFSNSDNCVFNTDSNALIEQIDGDILYLDPPYNARQYGANYHLLNTIANYQPFVPKGKTGLPEYQKSRYCRKATVAEEFDALIRKAKFTTIFLSYNNEGLMSVDSIKSIMQQYGEYDCVTTPYQRFKADNGRQYKASSTDEYLHILRK